MNNTSIHFYTVTKIDNLDAISHSMEYIASQYQDSTYALICPATEVSKFKSALRRQCNLISIAFIDENDILSLDYFKELASVQGKKFGVDIDERMNLSWYYQQALKLAYLVMRPSNKPIVMLDADTEIVSNIRFFSCSRSVIYTTPYEHNIEYKKTAYHITGRSRSGWMSSTVQFMSMTPSEYNYIVKGLTDYFPRVQGQPIGEWISILILKSTLQCHQSLEGSFFGEMDLIAHIHCLNGLSPSKDLVFLRSRLTNYLSPRQKWIALLVGNKHITYEKWALQSDGHLVMPWPRFIKLLIYQRLSLLFPARYRGIFALDRRN